MGRRPLCSAALGFLVWAFAGETSTEKKIEKEREMQAQC